MLVHDAARALTPRAQFDRVIAAVRATGDGIIPGLPVADTIKRVDAGGLVRRDRRPLAARGRADAAGLPARRARSRLRRGDRGCTDDAALVAAIGHPVRVIAGDERAFKITTPWDLNRAELLLGPDWDVLDARVGIGIDVHAFSERPTAEELWLAGLHWPGERGLSGHSDGDVVAHAICDALLSAAGLGDIGGDLRHGRSALRRRPRRRLPPRDACGCVNAAGFRVRQRLGADHRQPPEARRRAATRPRRCSSQAVGALVSVSATTTDGLGFTGRGEGVAAIATAMLVSRPGPLTLRACAWQG